MRMLRSLTLAGLGLAILLLPAAAWAGEGGDVFKGKCAMCHGADGKGETAMGKKFGLRDLGSVEVQKQSDAELTTIITKGKAKMPAYDGKLTAEQIKALVAHIRTLKH